MQIVIFNIINIVLDIFSIEGILSIFITSVGLRYAYMINKRTEKQAKETTKHNDFLNISTSMTKEKIDDVIKRLISLDQKCYSMDISGYVYSDIGIYSERSVNKEVETRTSEGDSYVRYKGTLSNMKMEILYLDKEKVEILSLISKDLNWLIYFKNELFEKGYFNVAINENNYYTFHKQKDYFHRIYYKEIQVFYNETPLTEKPKKRIEIKLEEGEDQTWI